MIGAGWLPAACEICRDWSRHALCDSCIARFAPTHPRCARCGLRTGLPIPACGGCLREPPAFERTVCLADYGFPWSDLIGALKFRDRPELASSLAPLLARAVLTAGLQQPGTPLADRVVPVPLAPQRLAERGYNQAWELARRVASELGAQASADVLLRPLDSAHQVGLNRSQRQHNLRSAFMVDARRRSWLQDRRVALVDDVMTTSATAQEAAAALRRAGAAAVDVWVLARTPENA